MAHNIKKGMRVYLATESNKDVSRYIEQVKKTFKDLVDYDIVFTVENTFNRSLLEQPEVKRENVIVDYSRVQEHFKDKYQDHDVVIGLVEERGFKESDSLKGNASRTYPVCGVYLPRGLWNNKRVEEGTQYGFLLASVIEHEITHQIINLTGLPKDENHDEFHKEFYDGNFYTYLPELFKKLKENKVDSRFKEIKKLEDIVIKNKKWTAVVNHHSAWSIKNQIEKVEDLHKSEWNFKSSMGFYTGYNLAIYNGRIYQFRALGEETVAHRGHNKSKLSVCVYQNFENETISKENTEALKKVYSMLIQVKSVPMYLRHGDLRWNSTACPVLPVEFFKGLQKETLRTYVEQLKVLLRKELFKIRKES